MIEVSVVTRFNRWDVRCDMLGHRAIVMTALLDKYNFIDAGNTSDGFLVSGKVAVRAV
jgi:hypothetical protein